MQIYLRTHFDIAPINLVHKNFAAYVSIYKLTMNYSPDFIAVFWNCFGAQKFQSKIVRASGNFLKKWAEIALFE